MSNNNDNINNIDKYYPSIDKNLINNLCKNNTIRNLINLSTQTDLYIFNKKNRKWQLKSKDDLLRECETIKKKELKLSSNMLLNLAKLNEVKDINDVKNIYQNLENKMTNINKLIDCIHNLETETEKSINNLSKLNNSNINIVDFDTVKKPNKSCNVSNSEIKIFNNKALESSSSNDKFIDLSFKVESDKIKTSTQSSEDYIECYTNC